MDWMQIRPELFFLLAKYLKKILEATMDQNQLDKIQQRAAEILADIIGRQYGLEIAVHVERKEAE